MYPNQENIDTLEAVQVTKVPPTTTATINYEVEYNEKEPLSDVNDRRNRDRSQPCKRSGFCKAGGRTLQICRGSKECGNPQCSFRKIHKIHKTPNKVDFTRRKACLHCKSKPLHINCTARNYVENDRCHKKMTVIYIGGHSCSPLAPEEKPKKEEVECIIHERPMITTGQIHIEKVRQALLCESCAEAVADVALKYSDTRHLPASVNDKWRPNGSGIEAIRLLKEDFQKWGVDSKLIIEVGEDFVILSSEQKIRIAALITTGQIKEPVSVDGCESHAKDFTELEMTMYFPVLRRNVKLATIFVPKPAENSDNVEKLVRTFDRAVNDILPSLAQEYGLDPH